MQDDQENRAWEKSQEVIVEGGGVCVSFDLTPEGELQKPKDKRAWRWCEMAKKRYGELVGKREIIGIREDFAKRKCKNKFEQFTSINPSVKGINSEDFQDAMGRITAPATPEAKALDGSYGGFQVKPSVEIIIVAMKPLDEKTYVDQALKDRRGITWLDDGRIPYESENDKIILEQKASKEFIGVKPFGGIDGKGSALKPNSQGRFPANIICSDNVLDDGESYKSGELDTDKHNAHHLGVFGSGNPINETHPKANSGSFSRYFSLDVWWEERLKKLHPKVRKVFPFLIVPKPSKAEKNGGLDEKSEPSLRPSGIAYNEHSGVHTEKKKGNIHPTCKPIKLMSYLITLGSREGDTILDPFVGSGTTAVACEMLNRRWIAMEMEEETCNIAKHRIDFVANQLTLWKS